MGCFAFKSGRNRLKNQHKGPPPGAKTPPTVAESDAPRSRASGPSMPTRSIQEMSEERDAQRLRVFDLGELDTATNDFSRALKVGEGGSGSVYRAFFRSAGGGRLVLAVKRLNERSLQVGLLTAGVLRAVWFSYQSCCGWDNAGCVTVLILPDPATSPQHVLRVVRWGRWE